MDRAKEIWVSYCRKPRIIDAAFLESIEWKRLRRPPERIVTIIRYMRDVELYSKDIFLRELERTPSGRDPIIGSFIRCWAQEESTHGKLLTAMLEQWEQNFSYRLPSSDWIDAIRNFGLFLFENACGEYFKILHMVWGAINELSTKECYRTLMEEWNDPEFVRIVRAIVQEEGRHAGFYLKMANCRLADRPSAAAFCRKLVERFWRPVGQWDKRAVEIDAVIDLFRADGFRSFESNVASRVRSHLTALGDLDLTGILISRLPAFS